MTSVIKENASLQGKKYISFEPRLVALYVLNVAISVNVKNILIYESDVS